MAATPPIPFALPLRSTLLLGAAQILAWGGSFFLLAVLADPIIDDTGWSRQAVLGALSLGVLVAGLVSPFLMARLGRWGESRVLALGTALIAAGLLLMAASSALPLYLLAWSVIGLGMAGGLYDALFAALGKLYGAQARPAIVQITLVSGFCTTIVFPLLAWLLPRLGWRGTCVAYAALLATAGPLLYRCALGGAPARRAGPAPAASPATPSRTQEGSIDRTSYTLVSLVFVLGSVTMTLMAIHLITILQGLGYSMAGAIALSTVLGPAQVGARVVDLAARRIHPAWTAFASCLLVAAGIFLLFMLPGQGLVAILVFGTGNGLRAVIRGTLPLAVFPQDQYARVMGRLARPALIGQAATPLLGSYGLDVVGARGTLAAALVLALIAVALAAALLMHLRRARECVAAPAPRP